jgi:hypothetical protein
MGSVVAGNRPAAPGYEAGMSRHRGTPSKAGYEPRGAGFLRAESRRKRADHEGDLGSLLSQVWETCVAIMMLRGQGG